MYFATVLLGWLVTVSTAFSGEVDLPPRGEGPLAFEMDVCSFRWKGKEGYEEITLRFPVSQFSFQQQKSGIFVATYRPHLRVLNEEGEVVREVEGESQLVAESLDATVDPDRIFMDMVQVKLPAGHYRGELTLSDLGSGRSGLAVFSMDVPEYDPQKLGMSDLYLSTGFNLRAAGKAQEIFRKGNRLILPNPSRRYPLDRPLFVYFEVYHLGYQAHQVRLEIDDRFGHTVWQDVRSFPGYRGEARFAEGIPLRGLIPGIYTLRARITAGREDVISERKFEVEGDVLIPMAGFDPKRIETARRLLKQFGGAEVEAEYSKLDRVAQAYFVYGFWRERNPLVAQAYYGPLLGYGSLPETNGSLLVAMNRRREVSKRLDARYAARLTPPDTVFARQAREVIQALLDREGDDLLGWAALGYAYLSGGNLPFAEKTFDDALNRGGVLPEVYNGIGLAHLGRKRWDKSVAAFEQALTVRPGWVTARVNRAMAQFLSGKKNVAVLEEALEADPTHPELGYVMGRIYEREDKVDSAEKAYLKQLAANPMHGRSWFDLGRVWLKQGKRTAAASVWRELIETRPELREECIAPLLAVYHRMGETGQAQRAVAEYMRTVGEETQALLKDVRLVASVEEKAEFEKLSPEEQPEFERAFWQRRDPTPATPGNERLVEHYRRVLYAIQNFSDGRKPWDKRGDIYIRYGEPAHKSRADDIRYETDQKVVRVKERLWMSIPPDGQKEIVARKGRLRTSMQDVVVHDEYGLDVTVNDFESIDFELNPNRTYFGASSFNQENTDRYQPQVQISGRDRGLVDETIRGYPLFPIDGGTRWEYWIYPEVAGGIEVVFTALDGRGNYDYPDIPQGRSESHFNLGLWNEKRPERQVAAAILAQSEHVPPFDEELDFHFDAVDFQGEKGLTRLEVYYGVPLSGLPDSVQAGGVLERGIAVFDSTWRPVYRKMAVLSFSVDSTVAAGDLAVDQLALHLNPGRYFLGVEIRDPRGTLRGAYTREVMVEPYVSEGLMLSDIEIAGEVVPDSTLTSKGGNRVLPMPSKTYRPGQHVTIYYEVYGLSQNEFGQTRYQMDYQIAPKKGKPLTVTILRAVGRLLGIEEKKVVTISYEQVGTEEKEFNYLEINVSGSDDGRYELEVRVTDLNSGEKVAKDVIFYIAR